MDTTRKPVPSDFTDAEWNFLLPYFFFLRDDSPQRLYSERELFDAILYAQKQVATGNSCLTIFRHIPLLTSNGDAGSHPAFSMSSPEIYVFSLDFWIRSRRSRLPPSWTLAPSNPRRKAFSGRDLRP